MTPAINMSLTPTTSMWIAAVVVPPGVDREMEDGTERESEDGTTRETE